MLQDVSTEKETRSRLVIREAEVGLEGLLILAKKYMAVLHPTRQAPSILGCCRYMRGKVCTAPRERGENFTATLF